MSSPFVGPEPLDADMRGSLAALRRAAVEARELSVRTGTPFYVLQDGQVVDLNVGALQVSEPTPSNKST